MSIFLSVLPPHSPVPIQVARGFCAFAAMSKAYLQEGNWGVAMAVKGLALSTAAVSDTDKLRPKPLMQGMKPVGLRAARR